MLGRKIWRSLFRKSALERELQDELQHDLAQRIADHERAGLTPKAARRQANIELGGETQVREACRDERRGAFLSTVMQDIRYGLRTLSKSPGFTIVAVLTLSLGIGANTAIFSVVQGVLLRALPFPNSDRLVLLFSSHPHRGIAKFSVDPADFEDWRVRATSFDDIAIWRTTNGALTGGDEPRRIRVSRVTPGFFNVLGQAPLKGRGFTETENQADRPEVAVIAYDLWQSQFGGGPALGKSITLDGDSLTVIGILPDNFVALSDDVEVYAPIANAPTYGGRGSYNCTAVARIKKGVTIETAQAEMDTICAAIAIDHPVMKEHVGAVLDPLQEAVVGGVRPALLIMLGAVGFVLLIACCNVAGLLLARAGGREREFGVRFALGAGRGRITRQLLTESMLLAALGGAGGVLLAYWGVGALQQIGAGRIPRIDEVGIDFGVLAFTLGVSMIIGLLAGTLPAFRAVGISPRIALSEGGTVTTSRRRGLLLSGLVVGEMALAMVVLVGAGLLLQSFRKIQQQEPGVRPANLATFRIEPRRRIGDYTPETFQAMRAARRAQADNFYTTLLDNIRALPGVDAAAATNVLPFTGTGWAVLVSFEDRPLAPGDAAPPAESRVVTPGFFETMGIDLLRGRVFDHRDAAGATRVAVINETMARTLWPDLDPIGTRFTTEDAGIGDPPWLTVVGIVRDVRTNSLEQPPEATAYLPFAQARVGFARFWGMSIVSRTHGEPGAMMPALRSEVFKLRPNLPVFRERTMQAMMADTFARPRFNLLLLGVFAISALILAAVGIYGVLSYAVSQHTRDIGIRMALGADASQVFRHVVGRGLLLAGLGVVVGVVGALVLTRYLSSMLFEVDPQDPLILTTMAAMLLVVAALACMVPARRATRVDPMTALRCE